MGAMAIADLVKTTLGPKGMDKILQSMGRGQGVSVTNDGATILKSIYVDNPAAKVLIDISKVQDDEVGDGTTSVVVLAGEFLREAEKLVQQKVHPMTIIAGFREAATCARKVLEARAMDNQNDPEKFRNDLLNIARTTLSSKILTQDKDFFSEIAVDAVLRTCKKSGLESIHIIKKSGGTLRESFLDEGFILDKKIGVGQPKRIENAKILVANTAMDTDKVKIYGARIRADGMTKVADIEQAEKEKMRTKCKKIIDHGINCFINRQLIYNFPEEIFADAGIMAVEHADFDGIERLALVLGADIASTFEDPSATKLGSCKLIEEIMIGEDKLLHFSGVELGEVRAHPTQSAADEVPRAASARVCLSPPPGLVECHDSRRAVRLSPRLDAGLHDRAAGCELPSVGRGREVAARRPVRIISGTTRRGSQRAYRPPLLRDSEADTNTARARPSAFADRQGFEGRLRRGPHGDYDGEGTVNNHLQRLRSRSMATEGTDAPVTDRVGGCCRTYGIPPSGRRRAGAADAREEGPRHGGTRAKLCTESTSGADPMRAELHSLLWLLTAGFVRPSRQR